MKFEEILPALRKGEVARRKSYQNNLVIFMQIPAEIRPEQIPTMRSIPRQMKILIHLHGAGISYRDQFIVYDFNDQTGTYYVPDGDDINGDDWEIVNPLVYNPYDEF